MADSEVAKLEKRIDELIATCDKLKDENSLLRGRQSALVEERAGLFCIKPKDSFYLFLSGQV